MDSEARYMQGRAVGVVVVALSILTLSWAAGGASVCRTGSACAAPASESYRTPRSARPAAIATSVHVVDPNAPREFAAVSSSTTSD